MDGFKKAIILLLGFPALILSPIAAAVLLTVLLICHVMKVNRFIFVGDAALGVPYRLFLYKNEK